MTNVESLSAQVIALPEIDLIQVMEAVSEHLSREGIDHLIPMVFHGEFVDPSEHQRVVNECNSRRREIERMQVRLEAMELCITRVRKSLEGVD